MNKIILIATGLFGLCLGSFIHVVICRFSPDKTVIQFLYDISFSRSSCPNCQRRLTFCSLIPVISWLWQKGKCRTCSHAIPIHYLVTELTGAIFCLVIVSVYGFSIWSFILIGLGFYFVILTTIDLQYLLLPNCFTIPIMLTGLIVAYFKIGQITVIDAFWGIILGYILLWLPASIYYLLKKQVGLGGGDIKLLSALGTWVHYSQLPILLMLASFIGIIYFFIINSIRSSSSQRIKVIPFGPFLLISGYVIILFV